MPLISFDNLVIRFGEAVALYCLTEIEKASGICPDKYCEIDPEIRLSNAIRAQDAMRLYAQTNVA